MLSSAHTGGSWKMEIPIWKMPQPARNICSKVLKASNLKRSLYAGFRNDGLCAGFRAVTVRNTDHSFLNPTDPEGNIYDISLVPQKRKDSSPLATIKGNWFKTDGSGSWEYGVYDSISILNNRIYTNENIRKRESGLK